MILDEPGVVTGRILLLGTKESCVYLLKGRGEYALLGGGLTYIIPDMIKQLKHFNIKETKIKRIIILHSHFDHCGIVPFFKKRWPWVTVTSSARAKELLSTSKVIESILSLNKILLTERRGTDQDKNIGVDFDRIDIDDVIKDGDFLDCGDLKLEVIEVPGHSSCSIAVYVSREKAMFASDAGGVPMGNRIFTAAGSNFDKYQASLEKMAQYEIDVYLAEHFGARTGEDGTCFLQKSMEAAKETRRVLEMSYEKTKDINESTKEITDSVMGWMPESFMPKEIIFMVIGQMMRFIAGLK